MIVRSKDPASKAFWDHVDKVNEEYVRGGDTRIIAELKNEIAYLKQRLEALERERFRGTDE